MSGADPAAGRPPPRAALVVSRRLLILVATAMFSGGLVIAVAASGLLDRGGMAMTVASREQLVAQRVAAERHIGRAYEQAVDQVRKARALRLAIPAPQADSIASKAQSDLFVLRHSALVALGQSVGLTADDAERSAREAEQAAERRRGETGPSPTPVLLAPRLYAIVARMGELAVRISDEATTALTASPTPSPSR